MKNFIFCAMVHSRSWGTLSLGYISKIVNICLKQNDLVEEPLEKIKRSGVNFSF